MESEKANLILSHTGHLQQRMGGLVLGGKDQHHIKSRPLRRRRHHFLDGEVLKRTTRMGRVTYPRYGRLSSSDAGHAVRTRAIG